MGRYSGKKCRLLTMIWMVEIFIPVELIAGYVTNSTALIADSFHMLSDVISLIIAFLSVQVSSISFHYHPEKMLRFIKTICVIKINLFVFE